MDPSPVLLGQRLWSAALPLLAAHPGPVWLHGEAGTGVTSRGLELAARKGVAFLDDAETRPAEALAAWLTVHPAGVLGAHAAPGHGDHGEAASRCLAYRLPSLGEDLEGLAACCAAFAAEAGLAESLPPALGALPCPGNLRGLRNRILRWALLGQLPEEAPAAALPLPEDDLASNLHVLERLLLHRALRRSYGNRQEAARRLGVSHRQIYLLIARHGDPVRGEAPRNPGPRRLRRRQNSSGADNNR